VPFYVWIALGIFVVCLVGGTIWAAINARRAWKRGRPALQRMTAASDALSGRSADLERRLAVLEPKTAKLQRDITRLSRSVARARVLLGVVQEANGMVKFARFFASFR
jgi:hypothetical protein